MGIASYLARARTWELQVAYMTMEVEFEGENGLPALAQLCGPNITYWEATGLPNFEGPIDGFAKAYPERMAELLRRHLVREV